MPSVILSSTELFAGKSALCMALALKLKERGYRVGYMKPVGNVIVDVNGVLADDDALTMKKVLGLEESPGKLSPILYTNQLFEDVLEGKEKELDKKLKDIFEPVSKDKDFMLLEGSSEMCGNSLIGLSDPEVAKITGSKIILVARYCDELTVDRITSFLKDIADDVKVAGIIFNNTAPGRIDFLKDKVVPYFERKGIPVFGVIPRNRALQSITAGEIADGLNAQVLAAKDHLDVAVENFIVGAMAPDSAIKIFRRKGKRAVITGGDRADLQMAALEIGMPCVILSGNLYPAKPVLGRAEQLGIPVLLSIDDTATIIDKLEELMRRVRVKNAEKIELMKGLFEENVDIDRLIKSLE